MSISEELRQNRLVFSSLAGSGSVPEEVRISQSLPWREAPASPPDRIEAAGPDFSLPVNSPPGPSDPAESPPLPQTTMEPATWESGVADMGITISDIRYPETGGKESAPVPDAAEALFSRLEREERLRPQRTEE